MARQRTPTGAKIGTTPQFDFGYRPHHVLDDAGYYYLGDPSLRYGWRTPARGVRTSTKLEMLCDHRIALACSYIFAPLLNAPWQIRCADPDKRAFFEAAWEPIHSSFMQQAVQSIPLGFLPMIKKLDYRRPDRTEEQADEDIEPWTSAATPIICTGFDTVYPTFAEPEFDDDGSFAGIRLLYAGPEERKVVPVEYALWITRGLAEAFGDYHGMGRLVYSYNPWWDSMFTRDLRIRHIERTIDPALKVFHPEGGVTDADDPTKIVQKYDDLALEVGQAFRSGATVNLPSTVYKDETTGSPTGVRMWDIEAFDAGSKMGEFEIIRTQDDADIFMGLLIPPQAVYYAKETLGGKSVTEILNEVFVKMLILEWYNLAAHAEEYVLWKLNRWNFPNETPRPRLETSGFRDEDLTPLIEFVMRLVARSEINFDWFNVREAARQVGWPVEDEEEAEQAPLEEADEGEEDGEGPAVGEAEEGDESDESAEGEELKAERIRAASDDEVLYEDDAVRITMGDVLSTIAKRRKRVGDDFADLLTAEEHGG